jgi:hypothetical protein
VPRRAAFEVRVDPVTLGRKRAVWVVEGLSAMPKEQKAKLSPAMTERQFDNGYWYATELKAFAERLGIPSAEKLRKDDLERMIKEFLRTRRAANPARRALTKSGPRDVDRGLRLDLPVVHYTSNRETKDFILREARKIDPAFQRKGGTRYLLNRWREEQFVAGRQLTYGDLVRRAMALNKEKRGPLRIEHGRYMNFVSDFMAQNPGAPRSNMLRAWHELKAIDAPKTYQAWIRSRRKK